MAVRIFLIDSFVDNLSEAEFILGKASFRITLMPPGFFVTWVKVEGMEAYEAISNGEAGVVHYAEFWEALEAVMDHHREM